MVLGIVDGVSAVDIMCASLPKSRCTKRTCYMYSAISMHDILHVCTHNGRGPTHLYSYTSTS